MAPWPFAFVYKTKRFKYSVLKLCFVDGMCSLLSFAHWWKQVVVLITESQDGISAWIFPFRSIAIESDKTRCDFRCSHYARCDSMRLPMRSTTTAYFRDHCARSIRGRNSRPIAFNKPRIVVLEKDAFPSPRLLLTGSQSIAETILLYFLLSRADTFLPFRKYILGGNKGSQILFTYRF